MELNKICFCTIRICNGVQLLASNKYKDIIIRSLQFLLHKKCVRIYGFAIQPGGLQLLWEFLKADGKEPPHVAFMHSTGDVIRQQLRREQPLLFQRIFNEPVINGGTFWQERVGLVYVHPASVPGILDNLHRGCGQTYYSSDRFYRDGTDVFGILTDYRAAYWAEYYTQ